MTIVLNQEYVKQEVTMAGAPVDTSGVYDCKITDAEIWKSGYTQSISLNLTLETKDEQTCRLQIWYQGKNGDAVDFNMRNVQHLMYITGVSSITPNEQGKVKELKNQYVGVFVKVGVRTADNGNSYYDYDLQGFYDIKTKQTAKEMAEKQQPEIHEKFVQRYKDAEPVKLPQQAPVQQASGIEGLQEVDNDDIPF